MPTTYTPRLSIDLTEEQNKKLNNILCQYGLKRLIFNQIVEDFLSLCDKHGAGEVVGAFTSRAVGLNEICQLKLKKDN